jgi:hypothetical protein
MGIDMTDAEWQTRIELAGPCRLMAHFGLGELAHNHVRVRARRAGRLPHQADDSLRQRYEADLVLVRPDQIIAWRSSGEVKAADFAFARVPGWTSTFHTLTGSPGASLSTLFLRSILPP